MTSPERQAGPEAEVLGRFEPSAYDLGITDDPEPVPYALTPEGEAALREIGPYPGSDDPERLAEWCGFPSAAAMEAAYREDEREMAAQSAMEARWEAEAIAEAEDPEAEPWP